MTKVHREAARFAADGYTIVLVGHDGHEEVEGTMGEAPEQIVLVQDEQDVEELEIEDDERIAYVTQTTLAVDETTLDHRPPARALPEASSGRAPMTSATRRRTASRSSSRWRATAT